MAEEGNLVFRLSGRPLDGLDFRSRGSPGEKIRNGRVTGACNWTFLMAHVADVDPLASVSILLLCSRAEMAAPETAHTYGGREESKDARPYFSSNMKSTSDTSGTWPIRDAQAGAVKTIFCGWFCLVDVSGMVIYNLLRNSSFQTAVSKSRLLLLCQKHDSHWYWAINGSSSCLWNPDVAMSR